MTIDLTTIRKNCYNKRDIYNRVKGRAMFRKFFIFALFATACGYVFASDVPCTAQPVWPAPGSDADVQFYADKAATANDDGQQNIRIVSKIGDDLIVENNINMPGVGRNVGEGWSAGADLTHPYQAPAGFNIFEAQAEMPLMHTEMMEDDGGSVLAISRSGKQTERERVRTMETNGVIMTQKNSAAADKAESDFEVEDIQTEEDNTPFATQDQVRSWVVASGQTLRGVLQEWCDKEGWDLVWNTSREYPIQASAVFKGRFMDVASALVRNFSRANPIPYAKFFKGNRVLVVTTTEE